MPKTSIKVKFRRNSCLYPSFAFSIVSLDEHCGRTLYAVSLPSTAASSSLDKPAAATTDDCRSVSVYDGAPSFEAITTADAKEQQDGQRSLGKIASHKRRGKDPEEVVYIFIAKKRIPPYLTLPITGTPSAARGVVHCLIPHGVCVSILHPAVGR